MKDDGVMLDLLLESLHIEHFNLLMSKEFPWYEQGKERLQTIENLMTAIQLYKLSLKN
jgi:hypothetical protein